MNTKQSVENKIREKTYTMNMHCENCKADFYKEFMQGSVAQGYHVCEVCGCKEAKAGTLKKIDILIRK